MIDYSSLNNFCVVNSNCTFSDIIFRINCGFKNKSSGIKMALVAIGGLSTML